MSESLKALDTVITTLISPSGCPWDREQTPTSLCDYIIEEAHELVEAIRHGSTTEACEELGDVLFLLVFVAKIYEEKKDFSLSDALQNVTAKMVRRHPHVFADTIFANQDEQFKEWERIKKTEKKDAGAEQGVFSGLPRALPPLIKAYRIHAKAARVDFTWDSDQDVEMQVEAEWLEFLDTLQSGDKEAQEHEFGDLLFSLVELGRRKGIKASAALDNTCQRFLNRFSRMEQLVALEQKDFASVSMEEKNALWDRVKAEEGKEKNKNNDK